MRISRRSLKFRPSVSLDWKSNAKRAKVELYTTKKKSITLLCVESGIRVGNEGEAVGGNKKIIENETRVGSAKERSDDTGRTDGDG